MKPSSSSSMREKSRSEIRPGSWENLSYKAFAYILESKPRQKTFWDLVIFTVAPQLIPENLLEIGVKDSIHEGGLPKRVGLL